MSILIKGMEMPENGLLFALEMEREAKDGRQQDNPKL